LDGGSARRKAATSTQNNTNTHTDIHAFSGIRTHDPSIRASEDSSCLRPRGHSDRRSKINTIKENTETVTDTSKELGLEVNTEKTKYTSYVDVSSPERREKS
jgi:hypothetical protein